MKMNRMTLMDSGPVGVLPLWVTVRVLPDEHKSYTRPWSSFSKKRRKGLKRL
jgi:hypothetical protein